MLKKNIMSRFAGIDGKIIMDSFLREFKLDVDLNKKD
jgi:hypothetical protein